MITILISIVFNIESFRLSTILYKFLYFVMFFLYYHLVYVQKVFTIEFFLKLTRHILYAYIIVLLLQQVAISIGVGYAPPINLVYVLGRDLGSNSLSLEPSHSARIMTTLMLVLLRIYELKPGKASLTARSVFRDEKWLIIGFLWSMITMGSGTAFVGLAILSFYFIQKQYVFLVLIISSLIYFVVPTIDYEPLNRARATLEATITLDRDVVKEADYSAASRIIPFINTFTELELTKLETWVGSGTDVTATVLNEDYLSSKQKLSGVADYGLLSYLVLITFVLSCCVGKLFSIEFLLFVFFLQADVISGYYGWAMLMLFTTSKYFRQESRIRQTRLNQEIQPHDS
jgi:hypothetical protein